MEDKTREEKIETIRSVVNSDDYMDMMTEEELDEVIASLQLPIRRIVKSIFERVRETIEKIPPEILKNMGR